MSGTLYNPCEPFQAYNRLETRTREESLNSALSAKIHDPLWMLARQWQFGEFKGEDTGSAIESKVAIKTQRLNYFKPNYGNWKNIDDTVPMEITVEKLHQQLGIRSAYYLGKKLLRQIDQSLHGHAGYAPGMYSKNLISRFGFQAPMLNDGDEIQDLARYAQVMARSQAYNYLKTLEGKALDAARILKAQNANPNFINGLSISNPSGFIQPAHLTHINTTLQLWKVQLIEEFNLPELQEEQSWIPEKMEYAFDTASVKLTEEDLRTLHAESYFQGHLDWFSFDQIHSSDALELPDIPTNPIERHVLSLIPSEASIAGMPVSRWWEMEDGKVDLGNMSASDTDLAKISITQYAMNYSNDWLVIPFDVKSGSLCEVEGIVIKDVFGFRTHVEAAHKQDGNSGLGWGMYGQSILNENKEYLGMDKKIFIPDSLAKTLESEPIEKIKMIRDEMANTVWGIETIIPDLMGSGISGSDTANRLEQLIESFMDQEKAIEEIEANDPKYLAEAESNGQVRQWKPPLKYILSNKISENWIPFIPIHKPGQAINREIIFQRASMPRTISGIEPHAVRPQTGFLRVGIADNNQQNKPYFIHEEEVPRAGVTLIGQYQLTRWYSGKRLVWYGARKITGKGEGSSGLRFDLLTDNK
ncbi:hypothetical protein A33Q_3541 [Indibacter alkaliphilus LW1]|uniref:Uncharacterized protein n=1 Tax=Indibacter alkaliphilus (strain CCUG 57479 / KCTC 22604 / LW1) TaxID=1189612 RepID=S2D9D3_INDAL|nr:hypothetical protein [Indibacter alkaliphilus]EOZ93595.1 hypothetical protein A33Q_3541 [Indibacter alkaliphilus LW1]